MEAARLGMLLGSRFLQQSEAAVLLSHLLQLLLLPSACMASRTPLRRGHMSVCVESRPWVMLACALGEPTAAALSP
jgi:hypothetical protein